MVVQRLLMEVKELYVKQQLQVTVLSPLVHLQPILQWM